MAPPNPPRLLQSSTGRGLIVLAWAASVCTATDPAVEPVGEDNMNRRHLWLCLLVLAVATLGPPSWVHGRRGRGRAKTRSRMQIGLPVTGKYRDPESDQYYNHNGGAKIIQASHFDYEYTLGHKISFVCVAKGNPRPQITWFKDGVELYAHLYQTVHEYILDKEQIKSKLEIDPATQMDAGVYECSADNMYAIDRRSFKTDFSIIFD